MGQAASRRFSQYYAKMKGRLQTLKTVLLSATPDFSGCATCLGSIPSTPARGMKVWSRQCTWPEILGGLSVPGGHEQRIVAVDYGTTNPMVFLDIYDHGKTFWAAREYYWDSAHTMRQKTDSEYADDLLKFIGPHNNAKVIIDKSAASFKA